MPRERSRMTPRTAGFSQIRGTSDIFPSSLPFDTEYVVDEGPGYHQDSPFYSRKITRTGGTYSGDTPLWIHRNVPFDRYAFGIQQDVDFISHMSDTQAANRMLAGTNPSAPTFDAVAFFGELKDLPRLVEVGGRDFYQKAASLNLNFQFGIKPFISDLLSLLNFENVVDERFRMLQSLRERGIKKAKQVVEHKKATEANKNVLINSSGQVSAIADELITFESQKWAYTTWYVDTGLPTSDRELRALARRAAFGLNSSFASAWELIPWSWLIDWFGHVGDFLTANRNFLGISHGPVCVCRHETSVLESRNIRIGPYPVDHAEFACKIETKRRSLPTFDPLDIALPCITEGQMSILGSLHVLKR